MTAFITTVPATPRRSNVSDHRRCQTVPICTAHQDRNAVKAGALLRNIADRLEQELPSLFSSSPDYSIYAPDVIFEDPLNKFRGISKYAANINFLNKSPVFSSANLTLHHTSIISYDTIRTRWTLSMVVNLPWAPCVAFTGQSDYVVDLSTGQVVRHYDYWDSLDDNKFFSFPAVADLLAQCRAHIGPRDLSGFQLLRRTQHFQIRKFNKPIVVGRANDSQIQVWQPAQDGDPISYVAVIVLPSPPKDDKYILDQSNRLRSLLRGKSYVTVGEKCYYVRLQLRAQVFHEIWLQLSHATAFVDT